MAAAARAVVMATALTSFSRSTECQLTLTLAGRRGLLAIACQHPARCRVAC